MNNELVNQILPRQGMRFFHRQELVLILFFEATTTLSLEMIQPIFYAAATKVTFANCAKIFHLKTPLMIVRSLHLVEVVDKCDMLDF